MWQDDCKQIRKDILLAAKNSGKVGAHIAPSLSLVEILYAILTNEKNGDSFVLSKGHGALGLYAVMHKLGKITDKQFGTFECDGEDFPGQPSRSINNNIEFSSGSLGMGLSYAVGVALSKKKQKVYVVTGDGELDEGSVWEAASLANQTDLSNLVAVIDNNDMQSDGKRQNILSINLKSVWQAFGWKCVECDGHNVDEIINAINTKSSKPLVVIAHTVKGKGVSFMENNNDWHHKELTEKEYNLAIDEL